MNESLLGPTELPSASDSIQVPPAPGLARWVREGLRAAFLLRPRVDGGEPRPRELLPIAIACVLLDVAVGRLEVAGPAEFDLGTWLGVNWGLAACALLVWALLPPAVEGAPRRPGVASWFALWLVASAVPGLVSEALDILAVRDLLPDALGDSALFAWSTWLGLWAWTLAIVLRLGWHFGLRRARLAALGAGFFLVLAITSWQFPDRPWQAPADDGDDEEDDTPQMQLDPQHYQTQQEQIDRAVAGLQATA
jgi:hypothetical protein